jgi:hypothetical protein
MECVKHGFQSEKEAVGLLRIRRKKYPCDQGFRARVYHCAKCLLYHITNHEKEGATTRKSSYRSQKIRRQNLRRKRMADRHMISSADWQIGTAILPEDQR